MEGYLNSLKKEQCFGCEGCIQVCPKDAIKIQEDEEAFRYPVVDKEKCVQCGMCNRVCPYENMPPKDKGKKIAFGGYIKDLKVREQSTSGGAFSAIADAWCDSNYVIFGATAEKLNVYHTYTDDKNNMEAFRKSKYSQSNMGKSFIQVKEFLLQGKKVLFSGTPCQIAGLVSFLGEVNRDNLLTVEVICEGVPSPHFIRKYDKWMYDRKKSKIKHIDYRYKDKNKWDFEVMYTELESGCTFKCDRWFNPFWSVWLNHLMTRPSCYECPFTTVERVADVSLGDLWGVHLYCPELYGGNRGASLIICNTEKGKGVLQEAKKFLLGHELDFETALKYQSPMRKTISKNEKRGECMNDLSNDNIGYKDFCHKWATYPSIKLIFEKYFFGNRQKIFFWKLKQKLLNRGE